MDRKIVNVLLLLFIFLVFYNTLIPFQFSIDAIKNAKIQFGFYNQHGELGSLTDFVGNVILFLPFGFLFLLWLNHRDKKNKILKTVFCAILFSLSIEMLQLFLPKRTTSVTDLILNTLGAFIGLLCTMIYLRFFSKRIASFSRDMIQDKPLMLVLLIIGILQFFSSCVPFLISIKMAYLKDAILQMRIVPFQTINLASLVGYKYPVSSQLPFNWIDFIDNFLFWFVVGLLISLISHTYFYREQSKKTVLWLSVFLFLPIMEFPQIIIISRIFDVNDIIAAWMALITAYIVFRFSFSLQLTQISLKKNVRKILILYFVFVLYRCFQPFDFQFTLDGPISQIEGRHFIPFYAYFSWTSLWNIYDVLTALFYFLPFTAYYSYLNSSALKERWNFHFLNSFLIPFGFGLVIELAQAFMITRIADITDSINFGVGGFIGSFIIYYIRNHTESGKKYTSLQNSL